MKVNPPAAEQGASDAVIIIFGAAVRPDGKPSEALRHRVSAAAQFARRFARPLFIPTGAKGRHGDAEASVMAQLLTDAGFSSAWIIEESTGTDTLSSVRAVARMLPAMVPPMVPPTVQGKSPVYACTSFYHMPRCLVLLRLAGIQAWACPPPPVPAASGRWLKWYWRIREIAALPYDVLLMLWLRATGRV